MEHTILHPPLPGEEVSVQTVHPVSWGWPSGQGTSTRGQTLGPPGRRAFHISPRHAWHDGVLLMTPAIPGPSCLPLLTLPSLDTLPQPRRISWALRDTRPPAHAQLLPNPAVPVTAGPWAAPRDPTSTPEVPEEVLGAALQGLFSGAHPLLSSPPSSPGRAPQYQEPGLTPSPGDGKPRIPSSQDLLKRPPPADLSHCLDESAAPAARMGVSGHTGWGGGRIPRPSAPRELIWGLPPPQEDPHVNHTST